MHFTFNALFCERVRKYRMDHPELSLRNVADALLLPSQLVFLYSAHLRKNDRKFAEVFPKYSKPEHRSRVRCGKVIPHPVHREIIDEKGRREGYFTERGAPETEIIRPIAGLASFMLRAMAKYAQTHKTEEDARKAEDRSFKKAAKGGLRDLPGWKSRLDAATKAFEASQEALKKSRKGKA